MQTVSVLVVDDSAYIRQTISQIIDSEPRLKVVGRARNGSEALAAVKLYRPDVVVTDLNMPEMDGVEFIQAQMKEKPLPIVVFSVASETGHLAGLASSSGAVEFISKPTGLATEEVRTVRSELISKVLLAASIPAAKIYQVHDGDRLPNNFLSSRIRLISLGLSTGGPRALEFILRSLPEDFPVPLTAVVHMPVGYTQFFASRLNTSTSFEVLEAADGLALKPGRLILGQAGREMAIRHREGRLEVFTYTGDSDSKLCPSVDTLFKSAADAVGDEAVGVVLTGMGRDGTEGAAWLAAQGSKIIAESEESAVVFGMPRSVIESGLADYVEPLSRIPHRLVKMCLH